MMGKYLQLTARYMKEKRNRTILTILGVILSVSLVTGTGVIMESVHEQLIQRIIRSHGNFHVSYKNVTPRQADIISNHADIKAAARGEIAGFAILGEINPEERKMKPNIPPYRLLRLFQNDDTAMKMLQTQSQIIGGRLPETDGEIAVDKTVAIVLGGAGIGDAVELPVGQRVEKKSGKIITDYAYPKYDSQDNSLIEEVFELQGRRKFVITGILSEEYTNTNNYDYGAVVYRDLSHPAPDETFHMLVRFQSLENVKSTAESVARDAGLDLSQEDALLYNDMLLNIMGKGRNRNINDVFSVFLMILCGIILVSTIAVIYNSFNISLIERISHYGILRCIGASPSQIRQLLLREASWILLIGVPLGIIAGAGVTSAVLTFADSISSNMLLDNIPLVISPRVIILSAALGSLTVYISALLPIIRSGSIPAIEAVRSTGMFSVKRKAKKPKVFRLKQGFVPVMAFRSITRNRKRFVITLFSMVISVILFVSFGGILQLTRKSNVLPNPDLPGFVVKSTIPLEDSVYNDLWEIDGVETVYRYSEHTIPVIIPKAELTEKYREYVEIPDEWTVRKATSAGSAETLRIPESRILSYGPRALEQLNGLLESGDIDASKMVERPEAVLVRCQKYSAQNGATAYVPATKLKTGDSIILETPTGRQEFVIRGILEYPLFKDYNPVTGAIDVIISEKWFGKMTGSTDGRNTMIKLASGKDKTELTSYLDRLCATRIEYGYEDFQEIAATFSRDFGAISLFFYGFMAIIAVIGTLNVINTLSTNILLRTRELGIMRAIGLGPSGLERLIFTESMLYSLFSWIGGSVLGTLLWTQLSHTVSSVRETAYTFPVTEILIAGCALAFITFIAGRVPLRRIQGDLIIENIRREDIRSGQ